MLCANQCWVGRWRGDGPYLFRTSSVDNFKPLPPVTTPLSCPYGRLIFFGLALDALGGRERLNFNLERSCETR
jgi:hypothetical protein